MQITLNIIYIFISILLVVSILLQSGQQGGLSGAIAGGSPAMGSKKAGKEEILKKITTFFAVIFMVFSIAVSIFGP